MKRAIISVSNKEGVVPFAQELTKLGYEIISTGGTRKVLEAAGVKTIGISDVTGFPEIMDGRVKTLHPKVHGGLLSVRTNPEHVKEMETNGIAPIDMVVVNLYPFKQTIEKEGTTFEDAIENIDIGGPSMLRSAAKNHAFVTVVVDNADYATVLAELKTHGDTTLDNLTFRAASTKKYDYIFACGNKLTLNANVKCSSARASTYPYLVAGDYKTTVVNTDLTVLGGRWQSAYATGFKASHTGLAKLNIDGTNVTLNSAIRTTYSGTPSGDTEITLANIAASTVYLGTFYSGNISGDVTLYLKENVTGTFYTGARRSGNVTGTVTIVADGVDLNELTLKNVPGTDNTSGTVAKGVLCYASGDAIAVEGFDEYHIDTDTTVNLVSDIEITKISGGGTVELNGYKLTGEGNYAIGADMKTVSLRPGAAGLYFTGDFAVADELEAIYGIALSTTDETPVAQDNTTSLYTVGYTSVLVKDIMKSGNAENAANANKKVYARAYVKLSDGTLIYGETVTVTLKQLVTAIDTKWNGLTTAQQEALKAMYNTFEAEMASWKLPNIKKA